MAATKRARTNGAKANGVANGKHQSDSDSSNSSASEMSDHENQQTEVASLPEPADSKPATTAAVANSQRAQPHTHASSDLFSAYKSIGIICNSTPIHYKTLGTEKFVTVSVGHSWQTYNLDKIRLVMSSAYPQRYAITSVVSLKEWTFTTCKAEVYCYRRAQHQYTLQLNSSASDSTVISKLQLFGTLLLGITDNDTESSDEQELYIWDIGTLIAPQRTAKVRKSYTTIKQENDVKVEGGDEELEDDDDVSDDDDTIDSKPAVRVPRSSGIVPPPSVIALNHPHIAQRHVSSICHPTTYLNKLLIGYNDGSMALLNIHTKQWIYTFKQHQPSTDSKKLAADHSSVKQIADYMPSNNKRDKPNGTAAAHKPSITCIVQSPAVDVVGIGYSNGTIVVHNLKLDRQLMTFKQQGQVTALAFRTDNVNFLVSGTTTGHMMLWNLELQQLHAIHVYAHNEAITTLQFMANEPLLVSSGADNSIKLWIFDNQTTKEHEGDCRLLKHRTGHSQPPTRVKFYTDPQNTKLTTLLTTGLDRSLRSICIEREQQSYEYTQGHVEKVASSLGDIAEHHKLTPIIDFASVLLTKRQGGGQYANIVSCHERDTAAHVWFSHNKSVDVARRLINVHLPASPCTAVALDSSGNYALVGHADGRIDKFNMQSTLYRHSYGMTDNKYIPVSTRHTGAITGIAIDNLNTYMITTSLDATIRWWVFSRGRCEHLLELDSPISRMSYNVENDLMAVVCDDLSVRVIDSSTRQVVRLFTSYHHHAVTDVSFSSDGRWLITSSMDSTVRCFDLPTGKLIDWMAFSKPVTSVSFSPTNDFIATTHVNHIGINLWTNRAFYDKVYYRTRIRQPAEMNQVEDDDDSAIAVNDSGSDDDTMDESDTVLLKACANNDWEAVANATNDTDRFSLISYSTVPRSKWHTLAYLDNIRERNKPIEPPKQPKQAPFFLTALAAMNTGGEAVDAEAEAAAEEAELQAKRQRLTDRPKLVQLLSTAQTTGDNAAAMKYLKSLTPTGIDSEIRQIAINDFDSESVVEELLQFLTFILVTLQSRRDFEFIQSILAVGLRLHRSTLHTYSSHFAALLKDISTLQRQLWTELQSSFHTNLTMVSYLSNNYRV